MLTRFRNRWTSAFAQTRRTHKPASHRSRFAPIAAEVLEDRTLLSALFVTNTFDSGIGSLRQAILNANANPGADTIKFNVGNQGGGGPATITPLTPLPGLHDSFTTLDGTSQPGYSGTPLIEINGQNLPVGQAGIWITGSNNTVRGLAVNRANGVGIFLSPGADFTQIDRNYIGTDRSGNIDLGNLFQGVFMNSSFNTLEDNVISGNQANGVWIHGANGAEGRGNVLEGNKIGTNAAGTFAVGNGINGIFVSNGASSNFIRGNTLSANGNNGAWFSGAGVTDNRIQGNFMGTDLTGSYAIPNAADGIRVSGGAHHNFVGTDSDGVNDAQEGNVISGNGNHGLAMFFSPTYNVIAGNMIGTNAAGTAAIANASMGIWMSSGSSFNTIGGATVAARNVISGNGANGLNLRDSASVSNEIFGNYIGTNAAGTSAIPNANGIYLEAGASSNLIGGSTVGERNILSGNTFRGIRIEGSGTDNNVVAGNYIGTTVDGMGDLGNGFDGILIFDRAQSNIVGTNGDGVADLAERNVISGNKQRGVRIQSTGSNRVAGNFIGTTADGMSDLGNGSSGVLIFLGAYSNVIGTNGDGIADTAERNLISGNASDGVRIEGNGTSNNIVAGNYIGTTADGTADLGNRSNGVFINNAANNIIGGNAVGTGNLISGNDFVGVWIFGSGATGNVLQGNSIGLNASGIAAIGNRKGTAITDGASGNLFGTNGDGIADVFERNVFSGNLEYGLRIRSNADGNVVAGNYFGTDVTGTIAIGNATNGIEIQSGSDSNRIGTDGSNDAFNANERNIISGNAQRGIRIEGSGTDNNVVAGNYIGTNKDGVLPVGNGIDGILIFAGARFNLIGTDADGTADDAERNIISGNTTYGIYLRDSTTRNNIVAGNYIGTNAAGTGAVGNGGGTFGGMLIQDSPNNVIGGTTAAERNVISGNGGVGAWMFGANATGNQFLGNYIGTTADGMSALANSKYGIGMFGVRGNTIGGSVAGAGNVISGNNAYGIWIDGSGSFDNRVQGNYIGTNAAGTARLGNGLEGVRVSNGANIITIGTDGDGIRDQWEGNVISANAEGINVIGADWVTIAGNFIGTDVTGTQDLGNNTEGIDIQSGSKFAVVGTNGDGRSDDLERNIISGNDLFGVRIANAGTDNNVVAGNYIGTDVAGTSSLGNTADGIRIQSGASNNVIGGLSDTPGTGKGNVISGNRQRGVGIFGGNFNTIVGNIVGLNATGAARLGNSYQGVEIGGGTGNLIGGTATGSRNIISGNFGGFGGILIAGASQNTVQGNYIGTDITGTIDLGNNFDGIQIVGGTNNTIGGSSPGAGNVISGNNRNGVWIRDAINFFGLNAEAKDNAVQGNLIGTVADSTTALGNSLAGVLINDGADGNTIGTNGDGADDDAEANTIAFNTGDGVAVQGANTTGNAIRGNSIRSNGGLGIDLGNDGITLNDAGDSDAGPNNLQNFPELRAVRGGTDTRIMGSVDSTPLTTLTLDFYANSAADPSGYGEGERYLGQKTVTTDSGGNAIFDVILAVPTTNSEWITVTATDSNGNTSEFAKTVRVNRPPTGNAGGPYTVAEGSTIQLDGSGSSDPDQNDSTLTFEWDLDYDGSTFQVDATGIAPSVSFPDNFAARTIALRVTDAEGETDLATTTLTVNNVAPTVIAPANTTRDEGTAFSGSGSFADPGADVWTATVDYGDGTGVQALALNANKTFDLNHTYADNGNYLITVKVSDDEGGVGSDTLLVTVNNVAPQNVTISGTTAGVRGQTLAFTGSFTDPGADTHTFVWSVDNEGSAYALPVGTVVTGSGFSFIPTDTGAYSVHLTVTDDDGGSGSDSHALAVTATGLQDDPLNPGQSLLVVGGSLANDKVRIGSGPNAGEVTVSIDNTSFGTYAPGRIVIYAQAGDNDIVVSSSVTTDVWMFGGAGNDKFKGGKGNDVIIGGGGDDLLMGNGGRDLLIGGVGADRLIGNGDDDILIGAYTAYDSNQKALARIMAEWTSNGTFVERVNNIRQGTGSLAASGMTIPQIKFDGNVFDDDSKDVLTGSQGDDWFIWNSLQDRATDLKDKAFEGDLDWILNA